MDPVTWGLVGIGAAGGSLVVVGLLQRAGISINEGAVTMLLELTKYGGILYLLKEMARVFT